MDVREVLAGFAHGFVTRSELETSLAPYVKVTFNAESRSVEQKKPLDADVTVRPEDVRSRLQAFLRGEISAETLSEWASLIVLIDAFTWPGQGFAESTRGERAWLVIEELSAPEVHGAITPALAHEKLSALAGPAG